MATILRAGARTAFSGNYDAGRVAGTGTLEMRDARLEAV